VDFGPFGAAEIVFIVLLALVLLGPQRLPKAARTLGQLVTRLRRATTDLRRTLETELEQADEDGSVRQLARDVRSAGDEIRGLGKGVVDRATGAGSGPVARARAGLDDAARALRETGRELEDAVRQPLPERPRAAGPSAPTEGVVVDPKAGEPEPTPARDGEAPADER